MTPKSDQQLEEIRKKSREKIMNAALELFATNGFHSTSMSQVAKKAGVSKGLIYNYFKSKDELLEAIVTHAADFGEVFFNEATIQLPPQEKMKQFIEEFFKMLNNDKTYWILLTALMFQPDVIDSIRTTVHNYIGLFVQYSQEVFVALGHKNSKIEALTFAALLDGIMFHYLLDEEDQYPLEAMKKNMIKTYCKEAK